MTVGTTNALSGPFATNGVTTTFPFTFTAPSDDAVRVISRSIATGEDTVITTGFDVSRTIGGGGFVAFETAPATGANLYLQLAPSFEQSVTIPTGAPITATALERIADEAAARDQYLKGEVERAVKSAPGVPTISITDLTALLQVAAALTGTIYANTAAGINATDPGDEFTVVNANPALADIYLNDSGFAEYQRTIIRDPSSAGTAAFIGTEDGDLQTVLTDILTRVAALEA